MRWIRRVRLAAFDIPIDGRVVRLQLDDGIVEYEDPDGESYMDGWTTVEDLAWGLGTYSRLSPHQARAVAQEAVTRWTERLGPDHHFRFFKGR